MSYQRNAQQLEAASERLIGLISQLTHNVQTGCDGVESAAKVSVLAAQAALASSDFWEALSEVHCDTLNIKGETPCENSDDFADWARRVAHSRSYAPFEGIRSPTLHVDLRPLMAAE